MGSPLRGYAVHTTQGTQDWARNITTRNATLTRTLEDATERYRNSTQLNSTQCNVVGRNAGDATGLGREDWASRSNVRLDLIVAAARLLSWSVLNSTALGDADATDGYATGRYAANSVLNSEPNWDATGRN